MVMDPSWRNVLRVGNVGRMGFIWTLVLIASYFRLILKRVSTPDSTASISRTLKNTNFHLTCIVTGATSGIGKATAEILALEGYHVVLAGRSVVQLSKALVTLVIMTMSTIKACHRGVSLEIAELDLSSVASILQFVSALEARLEETHSSRSLQLLVNNAGILAATRRWTLDGYECMIASNFLGPFMLTQLLLPLLQKCIVPARIVNVVSFTHWCVQNLYANEMQLMKGDMQKPAAEFRWYPMARIYETSHLCLLLFTYEQHRRLNLSNLSSQVTVMAADPGAVQTCILRELPRWLIWLSYMTLRMLGLLNSPSDGAKSVVDAALAPSDLSGQYFFGGNGSTLRSSPLSYNQELATNLWSCASSLCEKAIHLHRLNINKD